jgi:uncharacterized protein YgfB (UPF0149 family)
MTAPPGTPSHTSIDKSTSVAHPLRGLLIAQFCGAFNDNSWKLMVALLANRQVTAQMAPCSHETANGGNLFSERQLQLLEFAHCMHRNDALCFVDILMPP